MKRGEIYVVGLDPVVGREASGVRPVVVISNDVSNERPLLVVIVPAVNASEATEKAGVPVTAAESGYSADLVVLATQPQTLDPSRFPEHSSGVVPSALVDKIGFSLKVFLDIK